MTEQPVDKIKDVSEQIQKILEGSECALQPFLSYSEYGIVPRVRLVDSSIKEDEQKTNPEEAAGSEVDAGASDSEQS